MRVVLDSNVLISALISPGAAPHAIYRAWRDKRFLLVSSRAQIAELRRASRYPKLRAIVPARDFGARRVPEGDLGVVGAELSRGRASPA